MGLGVSGNPKAEARQEKTESENGEGAKEQISASERVDGVDGGQSEDEINGPEL